MVGGSPIEVAGDKVLARPWQIDTSTGSKVHLGMLVVLCIYQGD
jgi:hypothetical protein